MAPSLLAADWSRIGEEIAAVAAAGADLLHLDVMDGQFVDNITIGPVVIRGIRKLTSLFLDTHLMVAEPVRYVDAFRSAGCDGITVHAEAASDLAATLAAVRATGAAVGMALNPATALDPYLEHLSSIDLLLIMSVHPGRGGQAFRPEVLTKVEAAARWREQHDLRFAIEIDGGIDPETAVAARRAGVDVLVAGTAVFRTPPYAARVTALRQAGSRLSA
ncbi:MAG TPA: ribulose-phosphate 3-epimerase [Candidatus Krumholzibacteria bacterium]|nr:ribulose-phosphate 3-epimerase [Candidatus Krumholzibacteria bacterium]